MKCNLSSVNRYMKVYQVYIFATELSFFPVILSNFAVFPSFDTLSSHYPLSNKTHNVFRENRLHTLHKLLKKTFKNFCKNF